MTTPKRNKPATTWLSEEMKAEVDALAIRKGCGSFSQLSKLLLESLLEADKKEGDRLIWPPQFNHYLPSSKTAQD